MGFAVWIDAENGLAWAQGTHEYRPMGSAVIASTDQFRPRDFRKTRRPPPPSAPLFRGIFRIAGRSECQSVVATKDRLQVEAPGHPGSPPL